MMQEVEVLKTIQELICSFFSEEQFTLSRNWIRYVILINIDAKRHISDMECASFRI